MLQQQTSQENETLSLEALDQFHGSESFYKHPLFRQFVYTEGVQYVAEQGEAFWLLEKIFACKQCVEKLQNERFLAFTLTKKDQGGASFSVEDGNHNALYSENILFTDFPLQTITFWFVGETLLLPSEY